MTINDYPRGSEWRKWDLHIHTPASFHWNGQHFNSDPKSPENVVLVDEMIQTLNTAEPAVFSLMDYWTFDGWFALKHRLSQTDAPRLAKTVFPGIELRLVAPMEGRLNAHVLFSNEIDDQVLTDFRSELNIALIDRPLSNYSLKCLARYVGSDLLNSKGYQKDAVVGDDAIALEAGSKIAEITCDSYKTAIGNVPHNMAIGFMPFNTNDGLAEVKWHEHYAYCLGLFDCSPIFETRALDTWAAFSGIETDGNINWIKNFQSALGNIPRLAVSGSDAHRFVGKPGNNDCRGYGDYPSGKATWIKADPTFEGLQQAIKEPAKRSFIGEKPPKKKLYEENKSLFLESLSINKTSNSTISEQWLDNTQLPLNPDLVAIIGNKGSGKSAMADIIALLGNSKQSRHFSFLKESRFRGRNGEPAKYFNAQAKWADEEELVKNLNEDPATENVELVKYIPQGHFEELCNAHVSGQSDAFENELRSVIFSHADDSIRLGALDFEQLIEQQESSLRDRLDDLRGNLQKINRQISVVENKMLPENRNAINEKVIQKQRLLDEQNKIKPDLVEEPGGSLSDEQKAASEQLSQIAVELEKNLQTSKNNQDEVAKLAANSKACRNIKEQIQLVRRAIHKFELEIKVDAELVGLDPTKLIATQINEELISEVEITITNREKLLKESNQALAVNKQSLIEKQVPLNTQLNAPQQAYQLYIEDLKIWQEKVKSLAGSRELPDTLLGLQHQIEQLNNLPSQRKDLHMQRQELASQIFDLLNEQREGREALFKPVQQLILNNALIRDGYKLQFKAELGCTADYISNQLFSLVKQNSGEFRGDSESLAVIKSLT
ncbi:ABC transporter, partial [bacterium]|nr:ABC transporter [bacterium]